MSLFRKTLQSLRLQKHQILQKKFKKNLADCLYHLYFVLQSTFMSNPQSDLKDIKLMMERSSRFISLSGLSGIAAGVSALVGAYFANNVIIYSKGRTLKELDYHLYSGSINLRDYMGNSLFKVATITFMAAFISSFVFTWLRSKKTNTPLWGSSSRRLAINFGIPLAVGGIYILKLIEFGNFGLIAPGCLLFYGLALVNASKYTLGEIRYLGYGQIVLGLINLCYLGFGIYFWAAGFGVLHIVYGVIMWSKYERESNQ